MKKFTTVLSLLLLCFFTTFSFSGCVIKIYNNDNDKDTNDPTIYKVGDKCPELIFEEVFNTAGALNENGEKYERFSIYEGNEKTLCAKGKVTILYYWFTNCAPCVVELPYLAKIKDIYKSNINIVAIHEKYLPKIEYDSKNKYINGIIVPPETNENNAIQTFLDIEYEGAWNNKVSWTNWDIVFVREQDEISSYNMLGGKYAYPFAVILNSKGVIACIHYGVWGNTEAEVIETLSQEIDEAQSN